MANYQTLKSAIQDVVKTNGNNEITGALLQQSLLAIVNTIGSGYQFMGVATPTTNPGVPDERIFYITNGKGVYTNFDGITITEDNVAILKWDSEWHKELTGAANVESVARIVGQLGAIERDIVITELAEMVWGRNIVYSASPSYNGVLVKVYPGASYSWDGTVGSAVFDHMPFPDDTNGTTIESGYVATETDKYILIGVVGRPSSVTITQGAFGLTKQVEIIEGWKPQIERVGYQLLSNTISSEATIKLGNVNLHNGDRIALKLSGTFNADWIIVADTPELTYRLLSLQPYEKGTYIVTLARDVQSLYLFIRGLSQQGTFDVEILTNISLDLVDIHNELREKYIKPVGGIPYTDLDTSVQNLISQSASIIGIPKEEKTFTPDEYNDFVLDGTSGVVVGVPHTGTWNSVTVPLEYGMSYSVNGSTVVYVSEIIPSIGMVSSQFAQVSPVKFDVVTNAQKFMMITYNTESTTPLSIIKFKDGFSNLLENGNVGLALGDSNVQATDIAVGDGEDAPTIMGGIMGVNMLNGGIGGTTYSSSTGQVNSKLSFDKIVDAITTRNFANVDDGLDELLEVYPSFTCLKPRYQKIKAMPLENINFVMVAYGTNDWTAGKTIDNENDKFDKTTILGSLRYGVKTLLEANPKLRIYVITPAYRHDLNDVDTQDSDNYPIAGKYLYDICNAIFNCCEELHIPCLNYYYTSGSNFYNRFAILNGGTHRTKYGYELMAKQYAKFILTH